MGVVLSEAKSVPRPHQAEAAPTPPYAEEPSSPAPAVVNDKRKTTTPKPTLAKKAKMVEQARAQAPPKAEEEAPPPPAPEPVNANNGNVNNNDPVDATDHLCGKDAKATNCPCGTCTTLAMVRVPAARPRHRHRPASLSSAPPCALEQPVVTARADFLLFPCLFSPFPSPRTAQPVRADTKSRVGHTLQDKRAREVRAAGPPPQFPVPPLVVLASVVHILPALRGLGKPPLRSHARYFLSARHSRPPAPLAPTLRTGGDARHGRRDPRGLRLGLPERGAKQRTQRR